MHKKKIIDFALSDVIIMLGYERMRHQMDNYLTTHNILHILIFGLFLHF